MINIGPYTSCRHDSPNVPTTLSTDITSHNITSTLAIKTNNLTTLTSSTSNHTHVSKTDMSSINHLTMKSSIYPLSYLSPTYLTRYYILSHRSQSYNLSSCQVQQNPCLPHFILKPPKHLVFTMIIKCSRLPKQVTLNLRSS